VDVPCTSSILGAAAQLGIHIEEGVDIDVRKKVDPELEGPTQCDAKFWTTLREIFHVGLPFSAVFFLPYPPRPWELTWLGCPLLTQYHQLYSSCYVPLSKAMVARAILRSVLDGKQSSRCVHTQFATMFGCCPRCLFSYLHACFQRVLGDVGTIFGDVLPCDKRQRNSRETNYCAQPLDRGAHTASTGVSGRNCDDGCESKESKDAVGGRDGTAIEDDGLTSSMSFTFDYGANFGVASNVCFDSGGTWHMPPWH
jgi:hypothetical protein